MASDKSPVFGSGLQDELEFLFAEVNLLSVQLRKAARETHQKNRLRTSARRVLRWLHLNGSQTVPQVARACGASRQHIQALVDALDADGRVSFISNPAHKRSDLVQLTERGQALLRASNEWQARFLADLVPHVSEAEVLAATALLSRLRGVLQGAATEPTPARPAAETSASAPSDLELPKEDSPYEELPVSLL